MKNKLTKNSGFTLVELLVVIAIIGLLSTLSIVALNNARMKARDAVRVASVKQIMSALELYYNDARAYPRNSSTTPGGRIKFGNTIYIGDIPDNPSPWTDNGCPASNFVYNYSSTTNPSSYTITYCLGGTSGGVSAGSHTATPAGLANP